MPRLQDVGEWIENTLPDLLAEHEVPAASVAVMLNGEVFATAHGLLSKATGVEATSEAVFQIGSITKLWTTSLAMQLVDEGAGERVVVAGHESTPAPPDYTSPAPLLHTAGR